MPEQPEWWLNSHMKNSWIPIQNVQLATLFLPRPMEDEDEFARTEGFLSPVYSPFLVFSTMNSQAQYLC